MSAVPAQIDVARVGVPRQQLSFNISLGDYVAAAHELARRQRVTLRDIYLLTDDADIVAETASASSFVDMRFHYIDTPRKSGKDILAGTASSTHGLQV